MTWRDVWTNLLPPARRRVTVWDALPLILFLAGFAGIWCGLEWTHTLLFAQPQALVWLNLCPWIWWLHIAGYAGLTRWRSRFVLFARLSLVGALVMLLAEPRTVRTQDVVSVVYALDVSDSVGDTSRQALDFIVRTVTGKPGPDEAGLIAFGRDAAVELPPQTSFPFESLNSQIDRDATNLEETLSLAAALIPEGKQGRIVVVGDGTQTEGNYAQVLDELKSRQIGVDFLPIQYDYERQKEVWLERLDLPQFVKAGETYEAGITLNSLYAGSGTIVLKENGKVLQELPVQFPQGKSRYAIPIYLREPGFYDYSATIQVPLNGDQLRQNNTVINDLFLEGEGKVLLVTDPQGVKADWEHLQKAIQAAERVVEIRPAYEMPRDPAALQPYDAILMVNVGAEQFDAIQLQAIHDAVYDLGVGLAMVGGRNSFGPGGYHRTVIEDALPVAMDVSQKKVLPKGALAIILHTCEFPEGNTWAKRITKQAIKVLNEQDDVGVLDYEGVSKWVFELQSIKDQYENMVQKINDSAPSDMPNFGDTMRLGYEGLKKNDAATKHMIIISDGDPIPPPPSLVQGFVDEKISVTMVAIFPHGGQEISKMRSVAAVTGGRYYFPADAEELPSIFIKEAKTLKREMLENRTFTPEVEFFGPVLKGLDGLPPLHGFVLATTKEKAQTILKAPPAPMEETGDIDPIYATWRYGLGTTAAYTSDLSPNWGKDWLEWGQFEAFVKQMVIEISRVKQETQLRMSTYQAGGNGVIVVEDFHPQESFLELTARVTGPREKQVSLPLKQVGPRRYQATLPLWGAGRYQVAAIGQGNGRKETAFGRIVQSYSPEYLRFRSSPQAIEEITRQTGGRILTPEATPQDLFEYDRRPQRSTQPVFDWWLWVLVCLIPLEVALRRVQLDWATIKSWFRKEVGQTASPKSIAALRQRRRAVQTDLQSRTLTSETTERIRAQLRKQTEGKPPAGETPPAGDRKPESKSPPPPDGDTTTGRLRALKRKRKEDEGGTDG